MTFFETVKNSVTVKQAAEHYGCKRMTDAEKKLLQAKHRMEEAQARDRVKERKARTRRLIQEGAILEKACQRCGRWSCPTSKPISCRSGNDPILYAEWPPGTRGPFLFCPVRAHLLTTRKRAVVGLRPPCALRGGLRLLREPLDDATARPALLSSSMQPAL